MKGALSGGRTRGFPGALFNLSGTSRGTQVTEQQRLLLSMSFEPIALPTYAFKLSQTNIFASAKPSAFCCLSPVAFFSQQLTPLFARVVCILELKETATQLLLLL